MSQHLRTKKSASHLGGLDYFKLLAAFLVVAIHTSPLASVSVGADLILTRIIARIAVPFFLMVTGYFLLAPYLFERSEDHRPLWRSLRKMLWLYGFAMVLYLPVNIYAGQLQGKGIAGLLRMVVFDGTFYHLWYLPAAMLGMVLLIILRCYFSWQGTIMATLFLYGCGLLGDSYFGFIADTSLVTVYSKLFTLFSYTRNGIFYTPIFLAMGAYLRRRPLSWRKGALRAGLLLSATFLLTEGLMLHTFSVCRHDSMYIFLLPCLFFLFQLLLSIRTPSVKILRTLSTGIYLLHPLCIITTRGLAKYLHLEHQLIDNSLLHYIAVCVLSIICTIILQKLLGKMRQ